MIGRYKTGFRPLVQFSNAPRSGWSRAGQLAISRHHPRHRSRPSCATAAQVFPCRQSRPDDYHIKYRRTDVGSDSKLHRKRSACRLISRRSRGAPSPGANWQGFTGVKLCLLQKKVFQAGFVLEGTAQLGAVIGQGLLQPLDFILLVFGFTIKPTQNMLDTRVPSQNRELIWLG